jgi:hypothetical protein
VRLDHWRVHHSDSYDDDSTANNDDAANGADANYETPTTTSLVDTSLPRVTMPLTNVRIPGKGARGFVGDVARTGDTSTRPRASPCYLLESGKRIGGSGHAQRTKLRDGRWRHFGRQVFFTAPDNSSPLSNKRVYSLVCPPPTPAPTKRRRGNGGGGGGGGAQLVLKEQLQEKLAEKKEQLLERLSAHKARLAARLGARASRVAARRKKRRARVRARNVRLLIGQIKTENVAAAKARSADEKARRLANAKKLAALKAKEAAADDDDDADEDDAVQPVSNAANQMRPSRPRADDDGRGATPHFVPLGGGMGGAPIEAEADGKIDGLDVQRAPGR